MKLLRALACAATLAFVLASSAAAQPALTSIKVGLVPSDDITPVLYAVRSGMFKKAGLDVQLFPSSSGTAVAQAVVGGSYEIGKSSLVSLMNAHLRGLPLYLIAAGGVYDTSAPYAELVVAPDSRYKTGKDLDGKLIGVPALNDLNVVVADGWVDQHGGDSKSLKFLEIPNSAATAALGEHRIDAYVMLYPPLAAALDGKKVKILGPAYDSVAKHFVFAGWFSTKTWADAHPDIVKKFTGVLYQAAAYTNKHHAETAPMIADMTKIPVETIEHMPRTDGSTAMSPREIQPLIDSAAKYKLIPDAFPAKDLIWTP
ncbi:MAG TPA: ABC transporter substrate-binding protein [Candidatus Acidoferrales bacterium]|nr:ABC transporter substrate-binding protein [Candidatus Acidoferrales bacterium]